MLKRLMAAFLILALLLSAAQAVPINTEKTLRSGARGDDVQSLQSELQKLGLYSKALDGVYGRGTVAAVKAFQSRYGLKADGVAGPKTLNKLNELTASAPETEPVPEEEPAEEVDAPIGSDTVITPEDYPVLRSGDRGEAVKTLQTALKKLGYYTKTVDGAYGKGTAAAVQAYQKDRGMTATGIADSQTQLLLYTAKQTVQANASSLRVGDSGVAVVQLKMKLWYLGFYTGSLTADFDEETRTAVQDYQKANNLTRDGIAGRKTLAALDDDYNAAKKAAPDLPDGVVSFLNALAKESGAACGTLVLSKDGETFLTWSFGGVDENTCFRIASVTKWVTAIGLMTLYDQGKLDLDRDVSDYLPFQVRNPAYPDTPVTARMLLSHTSSISPDAEDYHPTWNRIGVNGYDPLFMEPMEPGTQYAYADFNGALFGCLIEAITGESVQNYMDRTVFEPLGLTAAYSPKLLPAGTDTKDLLDPKGKAAISVRTDMNRAFNNKADPAGNCGYTVGRLFINTASLTRLAQLMLSGGELDGVHILNPDTVALMEADQPGLAESKYGLSTVRHNQFTRGTWYGHQGRYSGLSSNIYYQHETGLTLALVMNGYDYKLEDNIVMPAVTLLKNMETLEAFCGVAGGG